MKIVASHMKPWKYKLHFIASEIFYYSLFTYIVLFAVEILQLGFVSNFFNLNILLSVVLVSAVIMILTNSDQLKPYAKIRSGEMQNVIFLACGAGLFVYYQTQMLGKLAWALSAITILLIAVTTAALMIEKEL